MPISTDSEPWQDGDELDRTEFQVLDFLKEHPDEAFNIRELAEELWDIDWTGYEEQRRKREELPEGEYLDEDEEEDYPFLAFGRETDLLIERIRSLVEKGLVDLKIVDADAFGPEVPDDWEWIETYTYHDSLENDDAT